MIKPSTAYVIPFETTSAGLPVAADATPTAVLWRNGSAEDNAVVIVTTANTGIYHASFTTDSDWLATDRLWLVVSATIGGDAYTGIAWDSFAESDSKADVAQAVAQYDQRNDESTPGTIGWLFSTRLPESLEDGRIKSSLDEDQIDVIMSALGRLDQRAFDEEDGSIGWIFRKLQAGTSPGLPRAF